MSRLGEQIPALAALMAMVPRCTKEELDDTVKYLAMLQRGRGSQPEQPVRERSPRREVTFDGTTGSSSSGSSDFPRRQGSFTMQGSAALPSFQRMPSARGSQHFGQHEQPVKVTKVLQASPECLAEVCEQLICAPAEPEAARAKFDEISANHELKRGLFQIFSEKCRNCFFAGKGFEDTPAHSVSECKKTGMDCFMECRICANGEKHWVDDCPNKRPSFYHITKPAENRRTSVVSAC